MDYQKILQLEFYSTDLERQITVKGFLKELLATLFKEQDCFSGKRPFGNSGWDYDMAKCFVENKIIPGTIDDSDEDDIYYDYKQSDFDNTVIEIVKNI